MNAKTKAALAEHRQALANREQTLKNLQWSGKLSKAEKAVLWHATKAYDLDPALREVLVLGGNMYVTVAAMVRIATRAGDYAGCRFEELEPKEEGEVRYKCIVTKLVQGKPYDFEGIGRASPRTVNKVTGAYLDEMAQTRAKGRALRTAYSISLPAFEEVWEHQTAQAQVVTPALLEEAKDAAESEPVDPSDADPGEPPAEDDDYRGEY